MHLFGHTFDHDYYFELPREGERDTQSITRCFAAHHGDFRAFPRANRTSSTARNPVIDTGVCELMAASLRAGKSSPPSL